jgi:NitT/TauT family transport system substrate-binding protein
MFPAFAKAAGIDAAKVNWVVAASSALPGLLASGKVPCVGQFTVGEPLLRMATAPKKLVRFAYSDPGLSYYGNGIIATEATISSNPDLVRRFMAATIKGLKAAIADPADAGAIMHKAHPEVSVEVAKGETESVAELAQVKGKPLGEIDPAGIQATIDVVNGAFKLKSPVKVGDLYVPGFVPK